MDKNKKVSRMSMEELRATITRLRTGGQHTSKYARHVRDRLALKLVASATK